MIVMTLHEWFDEDIEWVRWDTYKEVREIVLKESNENSLLVNKKDAIALAKEFGLIVFDGDSQL